MNRLAGIIVAAIGLVLAILGITKIVPGQTPTGVTLMLFGGLIIGLSFVDKPDPEGAEKMSTPGTLGNIFFSPTEVFRNLRRHPRWLAAMIIMSILSTVYLNLFVNRLTPERVANFTADKVAEMPFMTEEGRQEINENRASTIESYKNPVSIAGTAVQSFAGLVFAYAVLAVIFLLFAMAMGGKINFWQAFSAAVYAAFPFYVIRFVLNTIILFLKDPADIHPILGQGSLIQDNFSFLVTSGANPVIYTLLASISILGIYWIWLNATGLKNTGERITGTIAWSAVIGVYIALVFFSLIMATFLPGLIS